MHWRDTGIVSAPALAAALRSIGRAPLPAPVGYVLEPERLVPMYRIDGTSMAAEAAGAAHLASEVAERLRRLAAAYGEWQTFEPEPYFDLPAVPCNHLVSVVERVNTVHVSFYMDALLPSFQAALQTFLAGLDPVPGNGEAGFWQEQLLVHWRRLISVLESARGRLATDIGYLAVNGADEERSRWRAAWQAAPPPAMANELAPPLRGVPTLTLSIEFPLPANRQPGRLQRLRRARARTRRGSAPRRSTVA